jgi:hypothetical protein
LSITAVATPLLKPQILPYRSQPPQGYHIKASTTAIQHCDLRENTRDHVLKLPRRTGRVAHLLLLSTDIETTLLGSNITCCLGTVRCTLVRHNRWILRCYYIRKCVHSLPPFTPELSLLQRVRETSLSLLGYNRWISPYYYIGAWYVSFCSFTRPAKDVRSPIPLSLLGHNRRILLNLLH